MPWIYNEVFTHRQTPGKGKFVPATGCGSPGHHAVRDYHILTPDDLDEPSCPAVRREHKEAMRYLARENEAHNRKMRGLQ